MKKIVTYRGKIRALLALLIFFVMVFGINRINSRNFFVVQESFESIYKDRVVVNDYIFRLGLIIENKKSIINDKQPNATFAIHSDDSVDFLLEQYAVTKFTDNEIFYFDLLKEDIEAFRSQELSLASTINSAEREKLVSNLNILAEKILNDLSMLSQIQVTESKNLFEQSNERIYNSYFNAQLELVFLIAICAIILTLLVVSPFWIALKSRLSEMN